MPARNARYPYHLVKLVTRRLESLQLAAPSEKVLLRLFEVLYFASLQTDEGRPCVCTVNYVDPSMAAIPESRDARITRWVVTRFEKPLTWDVRTLTKLAEAVDSTVSSLAVFSDSAGELFIWGLVDQELKYSEFVALDAGGAPARPGQLQATITGVGNLSVYKDYKLIGSLEQDTLVEEYHDVLWTGPVHRLLRENLVSYIAEQAVCPSPDGLPQERAAFEREFVIRWQNTICRVLLNIQQYRHGGGLLVVPQLPIDDIHIKYPLKYGRLPETLLTLAQHRLQQRSLRAVTQNSSTLASVSPAEVYHDADQQHEMLEMQKNLVLGCTRFVASLSRVDGFVLVDRRLVVHGFGVELQAGNDLHEIFIADDAEARKLRPAFLSHFGTRHRAMMRFCYHHDGAVGFVISQDGDIRATMKIGQRLVLWENINVQLAFRAASLGYSAHFQPLPATHAAPGAASPLPTR